MFSLLSLVTFVVERGRGRRREEGEGKGERGSVHSFIVALLSMLQASLTLPGIAGIVLTTGMAVDANVLIFERIREELRNGNSPQASIQAGYEKALSSIADANITTLIAAAMLFIFGTGPIQGFAVTLSLGIMTSMFTAIMGTRAVINLIYGGRRLEKLAI